MDTSRAPVRAAQEVEELAEDLCVLVLGDAVNNAPGSRIQRAEDIAFDVLSGGEHNGLLPTLEIGRSNLRIEVKVGFVLVEHLIFGRRLGDEFVYV